MKHITLASKMESIRRPKFCFWICFLVLFACVRGVLANPIGGTVQHGRATFTSQGPQLTIRTSDRAFINWQSFNIGLGETTTFIQPSSSSLVWNRINDPNPSQILGNLNANGYVVLQNSSGFYIGGQAAITTHGLLLTTAPIQMPDLSSGGPWQFNAPPPTAKIINYGHINVGEGSSAFLISNEIENHGSISAPGGQIGLFAGKQVLLSERPDGRGLSARVRLPQGSVDNDGELIADAGTIEMRAEVVNQGGLLQANSVREHNGVIELIASDAINLGPNSVIQAHGDSQGVSSGGSVTLKSDGSLTDSTGSRIDVSGGAQGGNGGDIELSASKMNNFRSTIDAHAQTGFSSGKLLLDPDVIYLSDFGDPSSGTVGANDPPTDGALTLDVNSLNSLISQNLLSQITLSARSLIELQTQWTLPASLDPTAKLILNSGKSIVFDDGTFISAGNNWSVEMNAGPNARPNPNMDAITLPDGNTYLDGIYLNGNSYLQTRNGNISLWADNEVIVNSGAIRTIRPAGMTLGGNIDVTTDYGDVNSGVNINGFTFGQIAAPYYRVNAASLGGISTASGGNVTIHAGGDVISYLPTQTDFDNNNSRGDAGTGCFGPGNVEIQAGGNVYGHYVLVNGVGTINAVGDIGVPLLGAQSQGFALSLISGSWGVTAGNNIYVQDIRNPNGIFNDRPVPGYAGYHYFDYDPEAAVSFTAGNSVEITGAGAPHTMPSVPGTAIPLLFPPTLNVTAGAGGFILDASVILFPSAAGDLTIKTTDHGDFIGRPDFSGVTPYLEMSDSAAHQWTGEGSFNLNDHAATPPELNNPNPVEITIKGNMESVNLYTTKATTIDVTGDIINCGYLGENLHKGDVTSITAGGQIYNTPAYAFVILTSPIISADPGHAHAWDSVFSLAVDPSIAGIDVRTIPNLTSFINDHKTFASLPDFVYDAATSRLGFRGPMSSEILSKLSGPLTVLVVDSQGNPVVDANGHLETRTYTFASPSQIQNLYADSQSIPLQPAPGFQIGGPGQFKVQAASINLGSSLGILSWGIGRETRDYSMLAPYTESGASIDVEVAGNLDMVTSTIASMYGGNVTVNSVNGGINLGSQDTFTDSRFAFGIYTSGHSDVSVTAAGDINIESSRIAAYNGGNIFVESSYGDVNVGSGGNAYVLVPLVFRNPATGLGYSLRNPIYGSGIVATSLPRNLQTPGGNPLPGNITVNTPRGNITATRAGILQLPLDGSVAGGPTVTLTAGTPARDGSPAIPGSIDLGDSGLIGGTVNLTAEGDIKGLIVSRQNSTINAAQNFTGTLLSAGSAGVTAGGTISGTVIGITGVSASGGKIDATLLSQNVSIGGGQSQSTLGTSAGATATSQAAAQQANSEAQQQVSADDSKDDEKKKKGKGPSLTRRVGRVTVILPKG